MLPLLDLEMRNREKELARQLQERQRLHLGESMEAVSLWDVVRSMFGSSAGSKNHPVATTVVASAAPANSSSQPGQSPKKSA